MDTISAIETSYKGYRFRSRLEARWAMFFDRVGVTWTHEPQPLRVAGEPYLPDFLVSLPGGDVVHEVKSLHECNRIQPRRVYLAGKMTREHEWRGEAAELAPEKFEFGVYENLSGVWQRKAARVGMAGATFIAGGPFRITGAHGEWICEGEKHASPGFDEDLYHKAAGLSEIVLACKDAISLSDLVCVHIATADAFGTLVEIGYAAALGKALSVTFAAKVPADDLWFAGAIANRATKVSTVEEAQAQHAHFINQNTSREYRLISGIGAERAAAMTFGDPLDVANRGQVHDWASGIKRICIANRAAAEAVRAHRFDGR